MDSFFIRQEIPADIPAIFEVNYQAFAHYDEALLVVEKGLQLGQYPVLIALSDKIKKCR